MKMKKFNDTETTNKIPNFTSQFQKGSYEKNYFKSGNEP